MYQINSDVFEHISFITIICDGRGYLRLTKCRDIVGCGRYLSLGCFVASLWDLWIMVPTSLNH